MITKNVQALAKICAKDSTWKPGLACVRIHNGKAVATDNFRLIEMPVELEEHTLMIPAKELAKLKIGKEPLYLQEVDSATVTLKSENATYKLTNENDTFPEYEHMFSTAEPMLTVCLNTSLLKGIVEAMQKASEKEILTFRFYGEHSAIQIEANKVRGLLMPVHQ
jgi:hypothetical protein